MVLEELIIATRNKGKAREIKMLLGLKHIRTLHDLNVADIAETGLTLRENAAIKSEFIYKYMGGAVLADDSGLFIHALGGEPGVYSARYAGDQSSDRDNITKVLEKMSNIPQHLRTAYFETCMALSRDNQTLFFSGVLHGYIAQTPSGSNGFGYDPIFIPQGYSCTLAELSDIEKNTISHRAIALHQLKNYLIA